MDKLVELNNKRIRVLKKAMDLLKANGEPLEDIEVIRQLRTNFLQKRTHWANNLAQAIHGIHYPSGTRTTIEKAPDMKGFYVSLYDNTGKTIEENAYMKLPDVRFAKRKAVDLLYKQGYIGNFTWERIN